MQKITLSKAGEQLFKKVVGKAWSYRAADSCYTKLSEVKKKHGWNWKEDTLVLSAGQSIDFMQCCKEIFPTITPTGTFLVLLDGDAHRPSGALSLALQGVQDSEMQFMGMDKLSGKLQQDSAGNCFTASMCLAFLRAVLLNADA